MKTENITYIDANGLICPVPLMLLKTAIDDLSAGAVVEIEVTDVHAELDFEIWCERFGHKLSRIASDKGAMAFQVLVSGQ